MQAVDHYREVLRSIAEHEKRVRTDDLQHLHAVHNLHQLLEQKPQGLKKLTTIISFFTTSSECNAIHVPVFCWSGVAPTLRDSQLEQIEADIRLRYRQRSQANVTAAREALLPFEKSVRELKGTVIPQ